MTNIYMFNEASFDDNATLIMGDAFDSACTALGEFGHSRAIHEILAKRIIEVARTGERNESRLCEAALKAAAAPKHPPQMAAQAEAPLQPAFRFRA